MSKVTIVGDSIEIQFNILERVLTLHGTLRLPLKHVKSVSTDLVEHVWWSGVRQGISIPGASQGTFRTPDGLIFSDYRQPDRCITLELDDDQYRKVIVEIDPPQDKDEVKTAIEAACR